MYRTTWNSRTSMSRLDMFRNLRIIAFYKKPQPTNQPINQSIKQSSHILCIDELATVLKFQFVEWIFIMILSVIMMGNNITNGWLTSHGRCIQNCMLIFKKFLFQFLQGKFLEFCRKLTVYGSAFFTGSLQPNSKSSILCHIGVNDVGIHIINMKSKVRHLLHR